jgi:YVTN family beta-propeller protein
VGNAFSNTVSVIAASKAEVVATVPVGAGSRFLALDPKTEQLYVTNVSATTVSVIDITPEDEDEEQD